MKTSLKKQYLLQKMYSKIQKNMDKIEFLFLNNAKMLKRIKTLNLFQYDYLYSNWEEYYGYRVKKKYCHHEYKKYIPILNMLEKNSYMDIKDLAHLGYKKSKLLAYYFFHIFRNKQNLSEELKDFKILFEKFYQKSFLEFKDLPFKTYEKAFTLRFNKFLTSNNNL